ncbi:hypothetical protein E4T49_06854 [Aureobasidium sp. EXF-10728]|nr:hypothetical protein E4T49_06854 [Aureobasidium sp. EXF-10728]
MLFMLFFLCPRVVSSSAAEYGVGFTLALDYGTASIWYANGTAVDVVKLEGGSAYKQVMRLASVKPYSPMSTPEPTRGSLSAMFFQDYLPSSSPTEPADSDAEAIKWMLTGLKAATETYVEEPLTAVRISTPFPFPYKSSFHKTLQTTVESLGPRYFGTVTASTDITRIYNLKGQCDNDPYKPPDQKEKPDDPPREYLALDYSQSGILAFVVEEDCGVEYIHRKLHNTTLGASVEFPTKHEDLVHAFKDLVFRPFGAMDITWQANISELVLLGESTEDDMLQEVLAEVFGDNYTDLKVGSDKRAIVHHPLFAGSRAAAMGCQNRLEIELTHEWDERFQGWLLRDTREDQRWWWW